METLSIISQEHSSLWRLACAIDAVADGIERGDPVDEPFFRAAFDYLAHFVDEAHHPKEDEFLFPCLLNRDAGMAPLVAQLATEHRVAPVQLAELRAGLAAAATGEAAAVAVFVAGLRDYVRRMNDHIRVEDEALLPRAREVLTAADWADIDAAFLANEDPLADGGAHAEYRELFHRLANLAPGEVGLGGHRGGELGASPAEAAMLLRVEGLESTYGRIKALKGIDMEVRRGEIVALVGANGAGKTTFLRTLSGVQPMCGGSVRFDGEDIGRLRPDQRVRRGICQSPEGRQVFGPLSVEDNLRLGAYTRAREDVGGDIEKIYAMFPVLKEKSKLPAGTLSGGQQQMLAIGRALMGRPKLLLLDEPSMGLAPLLVEEVFNVVRALKAHGITILLVEQNAFAALAIADRGYVLETGTISLTGTGAELLASDEVRAAYLGM